MAKSKSKLYVKATGQPTTAPSLPKHLLEELEAHNKKDLAAQPEVVTTTETEQVAKEEATELVSDPLSDIKTEAAVDDILKEESDTVLAVDDAMTEESQPIEPPKHRGLWHHKWLRRSILVVILLGIGVAATIPTSRYYVLNKAGVRSKMSVIVIDQSTQLPLSHVHVSIGTLRADTDDKGVARISNIKLGPQQLTIERVAFGPISQHIVIGWGSNPLGNFSLQPVGAQYIIQPKDYLSGKPIAGVQAASGDAVSSADKQGKITLTISSAITSTITVDITAPNYRTEHITIPADSKKITDVAMIPAAKSVFISKQSGKLDVVSMYLDGQERTTLLAGTGSENGNTSLAVDGAGSKAALVSTRDNIRDNGGYLLSALTLIDINQGTPTIISHAEHIQLIDWIGTTIVFEETVNDTDATTYHLVGYDYTSNKRYELGSAKQFNSVLSVQGMVYYAVAPSNTSTQAAWYRIKPDGSGRQNILNQEVWSTFRISYDTIDAQVPDGWYRYAVNGGSPQKIASSVNYPNRRYIEGVNGQSLWVGTQDGQPALNIHDAVSNKDTLVATQPGLSYSVRWLTDTKIIYRVSTNQEVADYAVDIAGGTPKKIADVVNSYSYNN